MTIPVHIVEDISRRLNQIAAFFSGSPKLTLLVRNELGPDKDGDLVLTNDELPIAIAALHRCYAKDMEAAADAADEAA